MARRRLGGSRRGAGARAAPAILVAFGLLIAAIVTAVTVSRQAGTSAARTGVDDGLAVTAGAVERPVQETENAFDLFGAAFRSRERIQSLEQEVAELRQWRALALALAERNARYESLLRMPTDGLGQSLAPNAGVAARLILDVGGPFRRTLLANAGAEHGVRVGYIALNEHGLIGRVVSVGRTSSRVLMLDDYNSRVPAMGQATRVRAVVVGASRSTPRLEGPIIAEAPRLDFLIGADRLREGEIIVTSGDGGLYPPGLIVGHATLDASERWRVRLATSEAPIDYVRLIPYAPPVSPELDPAEDQGIPAAPIAPRALVAARSALPPPEPAPRAPPPAPPVSVTTVPQSAAEDDVAPPAPDSGGQE